MDTLQAILLGILQGLTEYLPVSSSGHLVIASKLLDIDAEQNLSFTIVVHVATVLSTIVILWREIWWVIRGLFEFKMNDATRYAISIIISMIPIGIVGVFFKDQVEDVFGSGVFIVGVMLCVTALLLSFAYYARPRAKENVSYLDAFIIGLSQALAVLPGLSRSGTTIATGLLLGNKKETMAQFSFLMVIPPILGEAILDGIKLMGDSAETMAASTVSPVTMLAGFAAAFISGCLACKWMINVVRRGKLLWFAIYCALAGILTLIFLG